MKNNTEALNCNVQSTDVKKGRYERGSKKLSVRPTIQRSNEKGQTTIKKNLNCKNNPVAQLKIMCSMRVLLIA